VTTKKKNAEGLRQTSNDSGSKARWQRHLSQNTKGKEIDGTHGGGKKLLLKGRGCVEGSTREGGNKRVWETKQKPQKKQNTFL